MFNKVILAGNIASDVELKKTPNGFSVLSFSIAVNDNGKENVNFFSVTCWRQTAEFVSRWFKKGDSILVCGKLNNRKWEDRQGNKRTTTEIVADEVSFAGRKEKNDSLPTYGDIKDTKGFEELGSEDELPF